MTTTLYHGGTQKIPHPLCDVGRENLDFGRGFYLTCIKQQAEQWARLSASKRGLRPVVNVYQLDKEVVLKVARCKIFRAYDAEWLDFIVGSRSGLKPWEAFDYIEGGVANDRVIDTIQLYISGLIDADSALRNLSQHQPNNQTCLLSQPITDKCLSYESSYYAQ